jgi:hypothetical protein
MVLTIIFWYIVYQCFTIIIIVSYDDLIYHLMIEAEDIGFLKYNLYDKFCVTNINTTGVTCGAGTAYTSVAPECIVGFKWGSCC